MQALELRRSSVRARKEAGKRLAAATAVTDQGIPVLPSQPIWSEAEARLRRPPAAGERASCDPEQLRQWFNTGTTYIPGMRPADAGWCVLNVAVGKALPANLPPTHTTRNPSGGFLLRYTTDCTDFACDELELGIDAPDYVILPPTPG